MTGKSTKVKRPTITDVARLAGVSITTVSFVINNAPNASIPAETRARIHQAIAQLDYQPQEAARALRNQASNIITLAIPEAYNPHYMQTFAGVKHFVRNHGYDAILSITDFATSEERRAFDLLRKKRSDALILSSSSGKEILEDLIYLKNHNCIVTILSEMPDIAIDSVSPESRRGEELIIQHLKELGHQRIGYIYGVANHAQLFHRLNSCLEVQRQLGLPIVERWIRRCGPTIEEGYAATQTFLHECPPDDRPTALIVVNDHLATAVIAVLAQAGLRVPDDLSVASFDNTHEALYCLPPLTTIDYDAFRMGEEAARITLERLKHPEEPPFVIAMPARLIVRASTGPSPTAQS